MLELNKIHCGNCMDVMKDIDSDSVDCIVTDPPYFMINNSGNGFMGKRWDSLYSSKIKSILCKSKEFVAFVARFFMLMQVELNTKEESIAHEIVNTKQKKKQSEKQSCVNVQSVERNLDGSLRILKVNINSVRGIVLTKLEVLDLLNELSLNDMSAFANLNENALFVMPTSYIEKQLKNIVPMNALKKHIKEICVEREIPVTLMEEAKINGVIEAMIGIRYEKNAIEGIDTNANSVVSTAEEKKYKRIILAHTEKGEVTNYLISLLYAMFVMPELNKSRNSSFKEVMNREMIYRFHKNWAISALRVLKSGAFMFVMCAPRSDILAPTINAIRDAGFDISFSSVLHTFASGFPKAQNLSKIADKRAGVDRKIVGTKNLHAYSKMDHRKSQVPHNDFEKVNQLTTPTSPEAKALDGAYSGFQPKPAVEIVIVAMRPLEEKTYLDQALKNGHGVTWLDDCRIPYETNSEKEKAINREGTSTHDIRGNAYCKQNNPTIENVRGDYSKGRFPANVLCEDDVLDDGVERKSGGRKGERNINWWDSLTNTNNPQSIVTSCTKDEGSFSRYFSLDAWFGARIKLLPKEAQKTFPFLVIPKASKSEKNRGCETLEGTVRFGSENETGAMLPSKKIESHKIKGNYHPTCKPIKLMSWLITLASREGDIVLDPFCGSGTTAIAAKMRDRQYIGIDMEEEYCELARKRLSAIPQQLDSYNML